MRVNALWNCKNPYQGEYKKALCLCSAGLLRSPTIAWVMGQHGYNTRAAGMYDYALIPFDEVLAEWADIIICANTEIYNAVKDEVKGKPILDFDLEDRFSYRDPELVELIETKLKELELIK